MSETAAGGVTKDKDAVAQYWGSRFSGLSKCEIPLDRPRSGIQSFMRDEVTLAIDAETVASLRRLGEQSGSSLLAVLCSALLVVLSRYTRQADVAIGTVGGLETANQSEPEFGLLPLRADLSNDPGTAELTRQVAGSIVEAAGHGGEALHALLDDLALEDPTRAPLFQVMLILNDGADPHSPELDDLRAQIERCDALVLVDINGGQPKLRCEYDIDLVDAETAERLLGHVASILKGFVEKTDGSVSQLPLLTEDERAQLIHGWNDTEVAFPQANCLHLLFEAQAAASPHATALEFGDRKLTYSEFNRRANKLARYLRSLGIGRNDLVAVFMERSLEMMVAIYGIMKAGGAYVPLDPEYPPERLAFMMEDAATSVVLTQQALRSKVPGSNADVICLDVDGDAIEREQDHDLVPQSGIDDLAYVIFTSGSTGRPKGVMNSHRGICNRILWMQSEYGLDAGDAVLQKTPLSFDVSVWELFWPLLVGARLAIAAPGDHRDPARLAALIEQHRITTLHFVPSMLQLFIEAANLGVCGGLRRLFCSGEALPYDLQERFFSCLPEVELHNLYGPTEAAVDVSYWQCRPGDDRRVVPIGRPVANTQLYILDDQLQPVPIGVAGELHIGGTQVALGYLNRPDLTAAAFISDPFSEHPGARLYKTGDLARFLPDGNIEFLGRIDHQVKMRGLRIELGEIEFRLRQQDAVTECVVVLREDIPGDQRLVAYLVTNTQADIGDITANLRRVLPDYMVPSHILVLDEMPLGPSGKLDRKALPAPAEMRTEGARAEPGSRSRTEAAIAGLWSEVLGLEKIGIQENFFDIGGHSLLVAKVRAGIQTLFGIELSIAEMFKYPTVKALAERVEQGASGSREGQAAVHQRSAAATGEIAIVGMACRLPGAEDIDAFWHNLEQGIESVSFFSDEELLQGGVPQSDLDQPGYIKARSVLADADLFDASFFGYSPREAEVIDPQQRVFLECAWHALEDAGYGQQPPQVRVGVYAGAGMNTYLVHNLHQRATQSGVVGAFQVMISNDKDFLPTRTSYKLNLKGPSINIQTACSTSLVAVHTACRSLLEGECEMALAGGSTVHVPQVMGYRHQEGMILSSDGHCRAFDAAADGTVFGSGVAAVVLKRLEDALADGDRIHGVIKGSAINNDGAQKIGYTAPSVEGQAGVIAAAQAAAGVSPDSIGYVEAHGTGTSLGDPIEIEALTQAFRYQSSERGFCGIGSVKTNIGHVDAAAGVTGLIKAVLAIKHGTLPPSLHFESPNPAIDFDSSPFYVVREATQWPASDGPRRAGVSSFGIGGTNAHVVLEEAPSVETERPALERNCHLLTLSAKSEEALERLADRYLDFFSQQEAAIGDICFTANAGRADLNQRLAVVAEDIPTMIARLEAFRAGTPAKTVLRGAAADPGGLAFLLTGQGAQRVGMGLELYRSAPVFRDELDRCAEILEAYLKKPLLAVIFEGVKGPGGPLLDDTAYTQPALFAIEYALVKLWQSWGIQPDVLMGHSVGEYAAACVAGVFSLEDGLKLIAHRGRLMSALPRNGEMHAVFASEPQVLEVLAQQQGAVSLAAVNGPNSCVISGESAVVRKAAGEFEARGIESRALNVSHAFHSPLMEPMVAEFARVAAEVTYAPPQISFISNVTGGLAGDEVAAAEYWCRHIRQPVRFAKGMEMLEQQGCGVYLEAGPQPVLIGMGRSCVTDGGSSAWLASMREGVAEWQQLLESLGSLYSRGITVDWLGFDAPYGRRRLSLPSYPFERQRHWVEMSESIAVAGFEGTHPLLGNKLTLPMSQEVRYETRFALESPVYVGDHRVFGVLVVAGASHCAQLLLGARDQLGNDRCTLEEIYFLQPFTLSEGGSRLAQLIFSPPENGVRNLQLVSLKENAEADDEEGWVRHLRARILLPAEAQRLPGDFDLQASLARCSREMDGEAFYRDFWVQGPDAGPSFRWIENLWMGDNEAIAKTAFPDLADDPRSYQLHPGVIEACFQVLRACREFESQRLLAEGGHIFVPFAIERFNLYSQPEGDRMWCHARLRDPTSEQSVIGDLLLINESGGILASIEGFECRRLPRETLLRNLQLDTRDWLYEKRWQALPLPRGERPADSRSGGHWLILGDTQGVGTRLGAALEAKGDSYALVSVGDGYGADENGGYRLDPFERSQFEQLFAEEGGRLAAGPGRCPFDGIVDLWGIGGIVGQSEDEGDWLQIQRTSSASALHLIQAMVNAGWEKLPPLVFITRGVHSVAGAPATQAGAAPLWGLARVVVQEHPEIQCLCIDLGAEAESVDLEAVAQQLQIGSGEDQLAFRQGKRYAARLERYRLPAVQSGSSTVLRADATYLVTGGLGGVGRAIAGWLGAQGAGHLVLCGRSEWQGALPPELEALQQAGVTLKLFSCDVADAERLQWLLAEIDGTMPPLAGVIHAAGVLDDGMLLHQSWQRFESVYAPKTEGTWNLHRQTRDRQLDFFVCFSSASALLGAPGQSNYAAANAYMDALMAYRHGQGLPGVSIDWGPWASVGMAASMGERERKRSADAGWGAIDLESGLDILGRLLNSDAASVGVLPLHWGKFFTAFHKGGVPAFLKAWEPAGQAEQVGSRSSTSNAKADILAAPEDEREEKLGAYVAGVVGALLGHADIDPQRGFSEMGMDSLMGVELRELLQSGLGISLASTFAFDYSNIYDVVAYLKKQLFPKESPEPTAGADAAGDLASIEAEDLSGVDIDESIEAELAALESELERRD